MNVGDIVLIKSETTIKPFWHMARVISVIPGDDGKIRSAKVLKISGVEGVYPVNLLYPLELSLTDIKKTSQEENVETESNGDARKPQRKAAIKCRKWLSNLCN